MKPIKCDLPSDLSNIELWPLADFHIGDAMCDFKLIQDILEHIRTTPNAYCILGGDLMDTAVCSSIGDTYGANLQPMEQLSQCVKLFEPIKDKILCIVHGNHENRVYKADGIDMTALMATQLGLGNRYSASTAVLFLRFGCNTRRNRKVCYTIYQTHGSGGGRREGGKINRLADLGQIVDADIYVCAHTHLPAVFKEGFIRTDTHNNALISVEKLFVNTAAALKYGGYGDVQGYKPTSNAYPVILLDGAKKQVKARI